MKNLTQWWLNYKPLNGNEKILIEKINTPTPLLSDNNDYKILESEYIKRIPFNDNLNNYHITFSFRATNLIDQLFEKYVDDDTIVISSCCEHTNVDANLEKYDNKIILKYDEIFSLRFDQHINYIKKFKKAFVYIIGTQISNGFITPQSFFIKLKEFFNQNNIENVFVLDDVHGMFITPRDYSLFDYVLYTAHSLIRNYDMGLLLSKKGDIGLNAINWGSDYLEMLDIILKRLDKMRMFSQIMENEFFEYISENKFKIYTTTTPHIFSPLVSNYKFTQKMYDILDKNEIRLEGIEFDETFIRFRAQHYIKNPEFLTNGLKILYNILDTTQIR